MFDICECIAWNKAGASTAMDFYGDAQLFAHGLRNENGLTLDNQGTQRCNSLCWLIAVGVIWGVENGADDLYRADIGGDIHDNNPAEEVNRFPESNAGKFYG